MESTLSMKTKRKSVDTQDLVEGKGTWMFTDTKCKTDRKTLFECNQQFQAFLVGDYQLLLQDDPCRELSKDIYKNISKSRIYRVFSKPLILPCPNVVEWITRKVDHSNQILLNYEEKHGASYQRYTIHIMYHFKEPQIKITQEFLQSKAKTIDYLAQMNGWWAEGNF